MPRYDLIGIDLDGTLLDSSGGVSHENIDAIARARDAGVRIAVCTGRGLRESAAFNEAIAQTDPVIVAGGAMIACPTSKETIQRFTIAPDLTRGVVRCLNEHGHAAVVLKDSEQAGREYLVISEDGEDGLDPVTRWWFEHHGTPARYAASIDEDDDPDRTIRIGACGDRRATTQAAEAIEAGFGSRLNHHHFGAVVPVTGDHVGDDVLVLEMFSGEASKWSALCWLADDLGCDRARIATIGNDINDLDMLSGAALGVAVENAVPSANAASDRVTRSNDEHGVAHAIHQILDGVW